MRAWGGWSATTATPSASVLTWTTWQASQRRILGLENRQERQTQEDERSSAAPLSEREIARLTFVRWLYQNGHFGPREACIA
jgi:hypothetical protein